MKKIITWVLSMIWTATFAQTISVQIEGEVSGGKDSQLVLAYRDGRTHIQDTLDVEQGAFTFRRNLSQPTRATLRWAQRGKGLETYKLDELQLYMSDELMHIHVSDSLTNATVEGGELTQAYQKYVSFLQDNTTEARLLDLTWEAMEGDEKEKFSFEYRERRRALARDRRELILRFAKENPTSYFSLLGIYELSVQNVDVPAVQPLFDALSANLKSSAMGQNLAEKIAVASRLVIGAIAPEFEQENMNGDMVKLSDFRGKYLLVDFWASWCAPCRVENPNLVKAYEKYKGRNFEILGVSLDYPGKKENWIKAVEMDGLTWPQVSDLNGWNNKVAKLYAITGVPQSFLIDPEGRIIARNLTGERLHDFLEHNLPN